MKDEATTHPASLPAGLAVPLATLGELGTRFAAHYAALESALRASEKTQDEIGDLRRRAHTLHGGERADTNLSEPLAAISDLLSIDCHAITDEQVAALTRQRGDAGTVAALSAAAMIDAAERMERVLTRVLPAAEQTAEEEG
ncbi:MAG: hypothetical protein AAF515_10075 [Pseudomonadota bacterium]